MKVLTMFVMLGQSSIELNGTFSPIVNDRYTAFEPYKLQRAFVGRATVDVWTNGWGVQPWWTYDVHGEVSGSERTEEAAKRAATIHARDSWRNHRYHGVPFYVRDRIYRHYAGPHFPLSVDNPQSQTYSPGGSQIEVHRDGP